MDGNEGSSTGLSTNVASALTYVGLWVSGIVFLFVETKDRVVRFHAMQSTITFLLIHTVMFVSAVVRSVFIWAASGRMVPVDSVFTIVQWLLLALSVALWIIFVVWSYQGRMFVVPVLGELASWVLDRIGGTTSYATMAGATVGSEARAERHARHVSAGEHARTARIGGSVGAIIWAIILFVMFNFYPDYIAYYQRVMADGTSQLLRYPVLTADLNRVLPILNVTIALTVVGHVIAIVFDHYVLRRMLEIVLHIFSIAVAAAFLRVFPFDFSGLPLGGAAEAFPTVTIVVLVTIIILLIIDTVVRVVGLAAHVITGD
ncbi:MAG TPA: hypothetical protein ENL12_03585 [Dehalococcoidia bacterium]|nr:hypothetical protein [Dehalococcoidia bacterium]